MFSISSFINEFNYTLAQGLFFKTMKVIWHICTLFILALIHRKSAQVNRGTDEYRLDYYQQFPSY